MSDWSEREEKARIEKQSVPFLDENFRNGPPSCSAEDFKNPRFCKSDKDFNQIIIKKSERLGIGADGCCWKVYFEGDDCPYMMKLVRIARLPNSGQPFYLQPIISIGIQGHPQ